MSLVILTNSLTWTSANKIEDVAKRTSDWLGVDFQTADMTESVFADNFEDATWYDEQIHTDLGFVGKHVLSKVTQDSNLKTILSGLSSHLHTQ